VLPELIGFPGHINTIKRLLISLQDGKDHPLKSWKTVATVADKILDTCKDRHNNVKGRLHSSDGWGVVIRDAPC
jgi:hypothetical protein